VEGGMNGDGDAQFQIKVNHVNSLAKGDFLLWQTWCRAKSHDL
jgi:hypothetical protein